MATPVSSGRAFDSTRSPAAAAQQMAGPVGSVLQTPGSAVTPSTVTSGSRTTPGRLPVMGLLAPTSASSSKAASAGAAGKLTIAAFNNREKCRDLFFSILRKCSSRLDTIRQQQQLVSSPEGLNHQASVATAAVDTELQEFVSEVGLAAKQLLLQLTPGNQPYLAELFTACVLQAASSGEPILEPQLAMMAVRDPGKFQKLQQRVELTTGRAAARQSAGQMMQQQAGGTPGRSSPAIQLEPRRLSSPAPVSWGELPAGQHVLMLVLHTADSSSFNRSLLHVMLERALKLLNSCPASFTAAGGLGQHAAALAALASYCSYLAFAAGCSTEHQHNPQQQQQHHHHHLDAMAAAPAANQPGPHSPEGPIILHQQPAVDVSSLLARAWEPGTTPSDKASSSDNSSHLDRSWYFALAVPFACRYLTFASFLPFAAESSSVKTLVAQLQQVQGAPPELMQPPDCIQSALASMTDPLKQQLQQALISQYSTDDMQVGPDS
eukprot:gene2815-3107_t